MEFNDTQLLVVDLFIGAFGRSPTQEGLEYFSGQIESGAMTIDDLANFFFTTEEAAERYPADEPLEDKVNTIFKNVLGREVASTEGMNFWKAKLADPDYSLGDMVLELIQIVKSSDDPDNPDLKTLTNREEAVKYFLETVPPEKQPGNQIDVTKVTADPATLEEVKQEIEDIVTIKLTKAEDIIEGTSGDDVFAADTDTLSNQDKVDGKEGNDTLKIDLKSDFNGFSDEGGVQNVENIVLTNEKTSTRDFSAEGIEGAKSYELNSKNAAIETLEDLENVVDIKINEQAKGSFETSFADGVDAIENTSDKMNLTLNSVGTKEAVEITLEDIEEVNLVSEGKANNIALKGEDLTALNLNGTGDVTITEVASSLTAVTTSGLEGALNADLSGAAISGLQTGDGNDNITLSVDKAKTNLTLNGGGGEDNLTLTGGESTIAYTMSGFETLTVGAITGELVVSSKNISDLSKVVITEDADADASIYNSSDRDLNIVSTGKTDKQFTSDNSGKVVLDYTLENANDSTAVASSYNFINSHDVTVNLGEYVDATGKVSSPNAEKLAMNLEATSTFEGTLEAIKTQELTINSKGGNVALQDGSDLTSVEKLAITTDGKVDFSAMTKDLAKAKDIEISSNGGANSEVILNNIGDEEADSDINIKVSDLVKGLTLGDIETQKDVEITADKLQGGIKGTGDITADNIKISANTNLNAVNIGVAADGTTKTITATDKADISLEDSVQDVKVGNITANKINLNVEDSLKAVTVGTLTVTEELDYKAGFKGATKDGTAPLDITIDDDATETTISLNGNIGDDKFDINASDYKATEATLVVEGDLGIGEDAVTVDANADDTTKLTVDLSKLKGADTVTITTAKGDDTIKGSVGADTIDAGAGADKIEAGDGDDTIDAGDGADTIEAGAGDDTIKVGDADTKIDGGDGSDTLLATAATLDLSDTAITNIETIDLTGDATSLTVSGAISSVTAVKGDSGDVVTFEGTDNDDTIDISGITFTDATGKITGGKGNDTITLSDGVDTIVRNGDGTTDGTDTINNFTAGATNGDIIDFETSAVANVTSADKFAVQENADNTNTELTKGIVAIDNQDGKNISAASLSAEDVAKYLADTDGDGTGTDAIIYDNTNSVSYIIVSDGQDSALFLADATGNGDTTIDASELTKIVTFVGISDAGSFTADNFDGFSS
jgi:hypothetical protein